MSDRTVRGPERESLLECLTVNTCCRKHADFGIRIDQVALARSAISNKEKATVISRSTGRHQWAGKAFPDIEQGFLHLVASLPNRAWYQQSVTEGEVVEGGENLPVFCCKEN